MFDTNNERFNNTGLQSLRFYTREYEDIDRLKRELFLYGYNSDHRKIDKVDLTVLATAQCQEADNYA